MIEFEWNRSKDAANQKKHGVSFDKAQSVFFDEHAIQFYDNSHAKSEDRFIILCISIKSRILVARHCLRMLQQGKSDETIRIISARKATKAEQPFYTR